jgi:protein-tyrosine phosphatase
MPDYGGEDPYGEPDTQRRDTKTLHFTKYEWPDGLRLYRYDDGSVPTFQPPLEFGRLGKRRLPFPGPRSNTWEAVVSIRRIPFAGALNFRDIGGYPVRGGGLTRWGAVYRSDSLHNLTAADLPAFDALGVKTIYDLRRAREIEQWPGPREYVHLEIPGGALDLVPVAQLQTRRDAEEWLAADYVGMLDNAASAFGTLLTRLAGEEVRPAVLHCLGGKDRTGLSVALLLTLLGVDRDTVLDDYELTSECQRPRLAEVVEIFAAVGMSREGAEAVLGTPRWTMARALSELDGTYGGIESYLLGPCGMAQPAITALRESLTSQS